MTVVFLTWTEPRQLADGSRARVASKTAVVRDRVLRIGGSLLGGMSVSIIPALLAIFRSI